MSEAWVKREGDYIASFDKADNGDLAVMTSARIKGDTLVIEKQEVIHSDQ